MSISSLTSAIKAKETAIGERVMSSKAVNVYWPAIKAKGSKIPVSKNVLIFLGAAIFAVCLTLLVGAYMAQVNEYDELSDELDSVEGQTASISTEQILLLSSISDADAQIDELDNEIIAKQTQLTRPLLVSGIFNDLLVVADDYGVEITDGVDITDISSAIGGTEEIAGSTYQAVSVNMTVTGPESNIYGFVKNLSEPEEESEFSHLFDTGVLKTLSIAIDAEGGPSASMIFTIYSL